MSKRLSLIILMVGLALELSAKPIVRILCLGNSFSRDAVEQYLYDIAAADDVRLVIGNLHIGGCSLERHALNAQTDSAAYEYLKTTDGTYINTPRTRMRDALQDEPWDYVCLQQASHYSGVYDTYEPYLSLLIDTIRQYLPQAQLCWQMTWAYAAHSTHWAFPNYGSDQLQMFQSIMEANRRLHDEHPELRIIPTGTAIQNARARMGDVMNRDGFHLHMEHGRYTAACTWWETIGGKSVMCNRYAPEWATKRQIRVCHRAAHKACQHPWRISQ